MKIIQREAIIAASGHFLTEYFPTEFEKWSPPLILNYIEEHPAELYENVPNEIIWKQILSVAKTIERFEAIK